jgi:hypothetical protein
MSNLNQDVCWGGQGWGRHIGREAEDSGGVAGLAMGPGTHGRRGQLGRVVCWRHGGDYSVSGSFEYRQLENVKAERPPKSQKGLGGSFVCCLRRMKARKHLSQQDNIEATVFCTIPCDSEVPSNVSDWLKGQYEASTTIAQRSRAGAKLGRRSVAESHSWRFRHFGRKGSGLGCSCWRHWNKWLETLSRGSWKLEAEELASCQLIPQRSFRPHPLY